MSENLKPFRPASGYRGGPEHSCRAGLSFEIPRTNTGREVMGNKDEKDAPQSTRSKRDRVPTNFFASNKGDPDVGSPSKAKRREVEERKKKSSPEYNDDGEDTRADESMPSSSNGKRKRQASMKVASYEVPGSDEDILEVSKIAVKRREIDVDAAVARGEACTLCRRCVRTRMMMPMHAHQRGICGMLATNAGLVSFCCGVCRSR